MLRGLLLLCLLALLVVACDLRPVVRSTMVMDGKRWVITACESAARDGFYGVDLTGPAGERVRVVPQPDESALVVLFPGDRSEPIPMPGCARSRMPRSNMSINGLRVMQGWIDFSCEARGRKIEGSVEFERCH